MHFWFVVCVAFVHFTCSEGGYYWRDYYGIIPEDAISAGKDVNNEPIYIGLAFVKKPAGIYTAVIQKGKPVKTEAFGEKQPDNFAQILCAQDPENFHWLLSNSTHLHLLKTDNEMVRGGVEDDQWLYIGRIQHQSSTTIGKVQAGAVGDAVMWFAHNGKVLKASSYEVLTYYNVGSLITVRSEAE